MSKPRIDYDKLIEENERHPKCKGFMDYWGEGHCGYHTSLPCDECKYLPQNRGRGKDPEAKCNE